MLDFVVDEVVHVVSFSDGEVTRWIDDNPVGWIDNVPIGIKRARISGQGFLEREDERVLSMFKDVTPLVRTGIVDPAEIEFRDSHFFLPESSQANNVGTS